MDKKKIDRIKRHIAASRNHLAKCEDLINELLDANVQPPSAQPPSAQPPSAQLLPPVVQQVLSETPKQEIPQAQPVVAQSVVTQSVVVPQAFEVVSPASGSDIKAQEVTAFEEIQETIKKAFSLDISDPQWPESVPNSTIIRNDAQKWVRADIIKARLGSIAEPILDFGCGHGHVSTVIKDDGHRIIGYDIKSDPLWSELTTLPIFTDNWESVVHSGPYKSIIMYDVIDHIDPKDIDNVVDKLLSVLDEDGVVYLTAHPYSGRSGGHLYDTVNKAFVHLLLDDELSDKHSNAVVHNKVYKPNAKYQKIFERFNISDKKLLTQDVEPWIINNIFPIIKDKLYPNIDIDQMAKVMQISMVSYTLTKLK